MLHQASALDDIELWHLCDRLTTQVPHLVATVLDLNAWAEVHARVSQRHHKCVHPVVVHCTAAIGGWHLPNSNYSLNNRLLTASYLISYPTRSTDAMNTPVP